MRHNEGGRWRWPHRKAGRLLGVLLLGSLALPPCVDPLSTSGSQQTVLCPPSCSSHARAGDRHLPFLRFARRNLVQPLASLALHMRPVPASLLAYLAALRGMRGGATAVAMAMPPSDFSHLGLSDLGQTSTALPEIEPRPVLPRSAAPLPQVLTGSADLHKMNLFQLQRELKSRGLSTRGLKSDLVDRLQQHITDSPAGQTSADQTAAGKRHHGNDRTDDEERDKAKKKRLRLPLHRSRGSGAGLDILSRVTTVQDADLVFEVFPTQAEAFRFADARPGLGLQVYSQDKWSTGAKSYVAATTTGFWSEYRKLSRVERHFGEIIRQGAPCRLYFDFEFAIKPEDDKTERLAIGNSCIDALLHALHSKLGVEYPEFYTKIGAMQVVELDSSSAIKFSRHLIVTNVAFKNNLHAGSFVKRFVGDLPANVSDSVDLGVYTRNRCFRIVHSSKFGKNTTFEYSSREHPFKWEATQSNAFMKMMYESGEPLKGGKNDPEQNRFMHSLITFTQHQATLLSDHEVEQQLARAVDRPSFTGGAHGGIIFGSVARRVHEKGYFNKSPFPALDRFVCDVARPGAQVLQTLDPKP